MFHPINFQNQKNISPELAQHHYTFPNGVSQRPIFCFPSLLRVVFRHLFQRHACWSSFLREVWVSEVACLNKFMNSIVRHDLDPPPCSDGENSPKGLIFNEKYGVEAGLASLVITKFKSLAIPTTNQQSWLMTICLWCLCWRHCTTVEPHAC